MTRPLWVWDVDGTVADSSHRAHLADANNWDAWHAPELIAKDTPIAEVAPYFERGRFRFGEHAFLTGRSEACRTATRTWLLVHGFALPETELIMRPLGDEAPVHEVKVAYVNVLRGFNGGRRIVVIDDHDETVAALRALPETHAGKLDVVHAPHETVAFLEAYS